MNRSEAGGIAGDDSGVEDSEQQDYNSSLEIDDLSVNGHPLDLESESSDEDNDTGAYEGRGKGTQPSIPCGDETSGTHRSQSGPSLVFNLCFFARFSDSRGRHGREGELTLILASAVVASCCQMIVAFCTRFVHLFKEFARCYYYNLRILSFLSAATSNWTEPAVSGTVSGSGRSSGTQQIKKVLALVI